MYNLSLQADAFCLECENVINRTIICDTHLHAVNIYNGSNYIKYIIITDYNNDFQI